MKMLWLRLKRWYHWYNSGRRILITEGPGTVYLLVGEPMTGQYWTEIGYTEGGVTVEPLTIDTLRSAAREIENEPLRPDWYQDSPAMRRALRIEDDDAE